MKKINALVWLNDDGSRPCAEYVFRLFAERFGFSVRFSVSELARAEDDEILLVYRKDNPAIKEQTGITVSIRRGNFFDERFRKSQTAPDDFDELVKIAGGRALDGIAQIREAFAIINRDVIASAFYLLSGYGDVYSDRKDKHGRVLSTYISVSQETWEMPCAFRWLFQLNNVVRILADDEGAGETKSALPGQTTIALTHDIDRLRKYRGMEGIRQIVRAAKSGKSIGGEIKKVWAVRTGRASDPYDSFDAIFNLKERVSGVSTFFVMGSGASSKNSDYEIQDTALRQILVRAKSMGDEIALHPSWESSEETERFKTEKNAVENTFGVSVAGSRQHYLRQDIPKTWRDLEEAGFRYDSTGGFPDRSGFKFGWAGPFRPFDLEKMEERKIYEIPLICMDVTLAEYEKIPAELSLERLTNLLDAACEDNPFGAFVFLWHNIMGDKEAYPGYADVFEYFFSVASGSSRFVTLSGLLDEFESNSKI